MRGRGRALFQRRSRCGSEGRDEGRTQQPPARLRGRAIDPQLGLWQRRIGPISNNSCAVMALLAADIVSSNQGRRTICRNGHLRRPFGMEYIIRFHRSMAPRKALNRDTYSPNLRRLAGFRQWREHGGATMRIEPQSLGGFPSARDGVRSGICRGDARMLRSLLKDTMRPIGIFA